MKGFWGLVGVGMLIAVLILAVLFSRMKVGIPEIVTVLSVGLIGAILTLNLMRKE